MDRAVWIACLPWVACLIGCVILARCLLKLSGGRLRLKRLWRVHKNEAGGVQSLSFVLTLPVFIMVMMMIVQASQLMLGTILVHYAAYASTRAAIVWIPANAGEFETENRIGPYYLIAGDDQRSEYTYKLNPQGFKGNKIKQAAVLACLPLAPSRDLGYPVFGLAQQYLPALVNLHQSLDQDSATNTRMPQRIANKLAYSQANTVVDVEFVHWLAPMFDRQGVYYEAPLGVRHEVYPDWFQYHSDEIGWRDQINVKVTHYMALLPGPARLLSRPASANPEVASQIQDNGKVYVWALSASASLGNEGEKPVRSYQQPEGYWQTSN